MRGFCFAVALGLVAWVAPVSAAPNWLGMTGLLVTPTADALETRDWNVSMHHVSDSYNLGAANVGLARGLEVGVVWFDPDSRWAKEEWTGQVKLRILPETKEGVALAGGWWDPFDQVNSTPYGVISKRLTELAPGVVLRGHFGVGGGLFDGVFGGADLTLARNLLAMVEYDGNDVNAGLRFAASESVRIDAGLVSDEFAAGISFNARF
ncbi:MAG: hypothetical protein QHJ73_05885 [Armatimonadota bacterium]|nr:hypothetical protein [Armatimonadota bacterium]